jgi:hypothetical protein
VVELLVLEQYVLQQVVPLEGELKAMEVLEEQVQVGH